jgi:integrase
MDTAPFLTAARRYLKDVRAYYRTSTLERKERDLRTIYLDLRALAISTTPAKLREEHVEALLLRWQSRSTKRGDRRGLDLATQEKLLAGLEGFLTWMGNPVITKMRQRRHVRFPRGTQKPIQILEHDELLRLQSAAESIEGWRGSVARFLVGFLPYSGLRPKEIRLAKLEDVDLVRGRILVTSPKGEGSWAAPDYAPIPSAARQVVEDYLVERGAYLEGEICEWLIPLRRYHGREATGAWSDTLLRKLKSDLQEQSGVRFRGIKTFRATFAQSAIDKGAPIEAVSRAMRHGSTRTTEAYYARIRASSAFAEIERAFAQPSIEPR